MRGKNVRSLVTNALVAAIYVAIFYLLPEFAYGPLQFRLSEGLNHLNIYHPKYKWGVIAGVFISNLYGFANGLGWYDLVFGTLHTALSFFICDWLFRQIKEEKFRYLTTILVFSVMIFIVALELKWAFDLPFWPTYFTTFISEVFILSLTAPVMAFINRRVKFAKQI